MPTESVIVKCAQCAAKNRIPRQRIDDRPVCGKCRAPLVIPKIYDRPVVVTDRTFQAEVLDFEGPLLLDCWAPWCGPCRMVAPVLTDLARRYAGQAKIAKLNVDENPVTASRFNVLSVPTILLFKNGRQVNTLVGALPAGEIETQLKAIL